MIGQGSSFTVTSTLFLAFTTSILAFPAFELNARGDTSNTNITISDKKVNWGDGYPPDIIEHIREACYDSGSCDETPIKIPITLVDDAGDQTEQDHIVLTPHGTYDGANRDAFVDALKAAASKGWKKDEDKWAHGSAGFGIGVEDGTVDHYTYTEYLSITRIGDGKDGTESMGVTAAFEDDHPDPGLCDILTTELTGISAAVNGVAAGFFTLAHAACSLNTGD